MKKTLVAIAALAATAAFAQSSVTISGNFDAAYSNLNAKTDTSDKKEITMNGASTSHVKFAGTEDLGGGLKAGFAGVHLINVVSGQTGNAALPYQTGNFFNDEIWVGLEGDFGALKLGAPNAGIYETNGKAQPFGTALGGGYSSSGINRLGLGGSTVAVLGLNQFVGGVSANGRVIRSEKSVRYDTPTVNGLSANVVWAAKNGASSTATSNSNGFLNTTLNYSNGPLNLAYSAATIEAGANAAATNTGAYAAGTTTLDAKARIAHSYTAANYTVGAATVYLGSTASKTTGEATDSFQVKSTNVALKYALTPVVDVLANSVKVKDAIGAKDQNLTGLSAIYNLSKTTSVYATYQKYDTDTSSSTKANQVTQTLFGLRKQF